MNKMITPDIRFIMNFWKGGGPRNVYTLSRLLNDKAFSSDVFAFHQKDLIPSGLSKYYGGLKDEMGARSSTPGKFQSIINLPFIFSDQLNWYNFPLFKIKELVLEPAILRKFPKPRMFIATNWQTVNPVYKVSQRLGIPMLYFTQAYEVGFYRNILWKKNSELTYRLPIHRITQSKWLKRFLDISYGGRNDYIGFGLKDIFLNSPKQELSNVISTIARNDFNKGFDVFVRAINNLWKKRQDFKVVIFGERTEISKYNIKFPYFFTGWIENDYELAKLYSQSIFVSSGRTEALPMPPLEAMATGSTVVISDTDGSREYTNDMVNCLVFPIDNHFVLEEKIDRVLSSEALRRELRKGALVTANDYSWEFVMERFLKIIKGYLD